MFSIKRSVVTVAIVGVSLALMAGCKTTRHEPPPKEVTVSPPVINPTVTTVATNGPVSRPPTAPSNSDDSMEPDILAWDSVVKEYHARPNEATASFSFSVTNVSPRSVVIYTTSTSCECTVAKLPSAPWTLPSGGSGQIDATVKLPNKGGVTESHVIVFTSQGNRRLTLRSYLAEGK